MQCRAGSCHRATPPRRSGIPSPTRAARAVLFADLRSEVPCLEKSNELTWINFSADTLDHVETRLFACVHENSSLNGLLGCGVLDHRKSGGIPGGNRTVPFGGELVNCERQNTCPRQSVSRKKSSRARKSVTVSVCFTSPTKAEIRDLRAMELQMMLPKHAVCAICACPSTEIRVYW